MLDGAPSLDSVFLPLKEIARQGNNPLRQPLRAFLTKVNALLTSRKNLPENAEALRNEQFTLRIRSIEWLIQEDIDLAGAFKKVDERLREREWTPDHGALVANMRFALHAQLDVLAALLASGVDPSKMDVAPLEQLGDLQFTQFESALQVGVPNQQAVHVLLGWMHASMDMEVALLMGDAVVNEEVRITPHRTDALNSFLVHAAQTYAASARLLGIVRDPQDAMAVAAEPLPASWVKGQKRLADEGLGDWLRL